MKGLRTLSGPHQAHGGTIVSRLHLGHAGPQLNHDALRLGAQPRQERLDGGGSLRMRVSDDGDAVFVCVSSAVCK